MNEETFYGYTVQQIRDLDRWKQQYNIDPDLIGGAYADGWRSGFHEGQEYTKRCIDSQLHHLKTNMPLKDPKGRFVPEGEFCCKESRDIWNKKFQEGTEQETSND